MRAYDCTCELLHGGEILSDFHNSIYGCRWFKDPGAGYVHGVQCGLLDGADETAELIDDPGQGSNFEVQGFVGCPPIEDH